MKIWKMAAILAVLALFSSGCATTHQSARRFHGASHVNAVLQFSSWDYTFLTRPRYDDHGFLLPVKQDNIEQVMNQLHVKRNTAVVVIGWTYEAEKLRHLVAQWKTILGNCGFRRAVFLRANIYNRLNGSLIIDDSTLYRNVAQANF